jgi:hypothetical protein
MTQEKLIRRINMDALRNISYNHRRRLFERERCMMICMQGMLNCVTEQKGGVRFP